MLITALPGTTLKLGRSGAPEAPAMLRASCTGKGIAYSGINCSCRSSLVLGVSLSFTKPAGPSPRAAACSRSSRIESKYRHPSPITRASLGCRSASTSSLAAVGNGHHAAWLDPFTKTKREQRSAGTALSLLRLTSCSSGRQSMLMLSKPRPRKPGTRAKQDDKASPMAISAPAEEARARPGNGTMCAVYLPATTAHGPKSS
mmetsp:Transcript_3011/g.7711  ORF Transcript_3011/g.7711 Transcript_3011/m.7711 type:complete len:202 (-) Transcript_3011:1657-2262(-)